MSDVPSIASASAYQQALISQQIQMATLVKANDTMKAQGEAVLALLQSAIDVSAAAQASTAQAAAAGLDLSA